MRYVLMYVCTDYVRCMYVLLTWMYVLNLARHKYCFFFSFLFLCICSLTPIINIPFPISLCNTYMYDDEGSPPPRPQSRSPFIAAGALSPPTCVQSQLSS
ncbi:hypothetical protein F4779DRAFT_429733 [Xylariaceae sp. FL0662B]|nr:hypothetical protein F4779DRAFT_429733 [Xylariaceae sp. FL0662B]